MPSNRIRVVEADVWMRNVRFRMPFRFGKARMTAAPICHLRILIEDTNGTRQWGLSADLLPPAWFDKRPGRTFKQDVEELLLSVTIARTAYFVQPPSTPFDLWRNTNSHILSEGIRRGLAPLGAGFGAALFERAVLDAAGRQSGKPTWQLIYDNTLGIELGRLDAELDGVTPAAILPPRPLDVVWARHTVGMADPITSQDLSTPEKLEDDLPQTLQEVLKFYRCAYYKIKIGGDVDADLERLRRIASVLDELPKYFVTLDGNEQYGSWDEMERFSSALQAEPRLARLARAVLFVEQPLPRDRGLLHRGALARAKLAAWRPLLIDENDDSLRAWPEAASLGYNGISFKGCKGFYRALRNKALASVWNHAGRGQFFLSCEDLTALPQAPLQQYLALGAILGIQDQERNGHHFVRGLDHLTRDEQDQAVRCHPDLYTTSGDLTRLRIDNGKIHFGSLNETPGLGLANWPLLHKLTPQESWRFESLQLED